jgi:hypothetical protein
MIWLLGACPVRKHDMNDEAPDLHDDDAPVQEARLWQDNGWTARVIKNEDDDGWAVAMYKDGQAEPALVGPWTMGRDKKNPKPLDVNAFNTLVKTAYEVLRRHEQQLHAQLHKSTVVSTPDGELKVTGRHRRDGRAGGPGAGPARFQTVAGIRAGVGRKRLPRTALKFVPLIQHANC